MATTILEHDLQDIKEQKDIDNIYKLFEWLMHQDDLVCVKMIMEKLDDDEETKKNWCQTVRCLPYATQNRPNLLRELLAYLGDYYQPLLDSSPNALVSAINNRSKECVSILFDHVQSPDIKDQLIATKEEKRNALIDCVRQDNEEMMELLVRNHSDIEPLLGTSFRSCLNADNIKAARLLLNQSKNKSSILNEKGDGNMNVLLYALQRTTDECLNFIVEELAEDYEKSKRAAQEDNRSKSGREHSYSRKSGRENSYSRKSHIRQISRQRSTPSRDYRSDDEDDVKAPPLFGEDESGDGKIHPMYFMTTDSKANLFHILMAYPEGAQSQVAVLANVLSKEQIQKMLSAPNQDDRVPLQCISAKVEPEVLEWILDQQFADETLVKFNMIAARNKFGNSNWAQFGATDDLKKFFSAKLIEYMTELSPLLSFMLSLK